MAAANSVGAAEIKDLPEKADKSSAGKKKTIGSKAAGSKQEKKAESVKERPQAAKAVAAAKKAPAAEAKSSAVESKAPATAPKTAPAKKEKGKAEKPKTDKAKVADVAEAKPKDGEATAKSPKGKSSDAAPKSVAEKTAANGEALNQKLKKPVKLFFHEVAPDAERVIKRGDMRGLQTPEPAVKPRGAASDETPEELINRIDRELERQHVFKRSTLRPQMCTKCGITPAAEEYTIDKDLGYCEECAEILHLGETKEARKIDFHPSLMKKEGEGASTGENSEEEAESFEEVDEE